MNQTLPILIVDDDFDDRSFIKSAFEEINVQNPVHFVENGDQLMHYLNRQQPYADLLGMPMPALIILDLNLPGRDGRQLLRELKQQPEFGSIPVVIVSTSQRNEDVRECYALGCSGYFPKPLSREGFTSIVQTIMRYWMSLNRLPKN